MNIAKAVTKRLGECEVCGTFNVEVAVYYGNIAQCDACIEKERAQLKDAPASAAILVQSAKIDHAVEVKSDLFNAATVSIIELRGAIEANPEIQNKGYALAEIVKQRIEKFDEVIFAKQNELVELQSARRAHVAYINEMSLRNDEREKLKLADISYVPQSPTKKTVKQASTVKQSAKSIKTAEIRAKAVELQVPEALHLPFITAVQMLVNTKGWELNKAAEHIATGMKG